ESPVCLGSPGFRSRTGHPVTRVRLRGSPARVAALKRPRQDGAYLLGLSQVGIVSVNRRYLTDLRSTHPRDQRPHVRERHELILASCNRGGGNEDARGIDLVQIERLRQAQECLGTERRGGLGRIHEQIALDREYELSAFELWRGREASRELLGASV